MDSTPSSKHIRVAVSILREIDKRRPKGVSVTRHANELLIEALSAPLSPSNGDPSGPVGD